MSFSASTSRCKRIACSTTLQREDQKIPKEKSLPPSSDDALDEFIKRRKFLKFGVFWTISLREKSRSTSKISPTTMELRRCAHYRQWCHSPRRRWSRGRRIGRTFSTSRLFKYRRVQRLRRRRCASQNTKKCPSRSSPTGDDLHSLHQPISSARHVNFGHCRGNEEGLSTEVPAVKRERSLRELFGGDLIWDQFDRIASDGHAVRAGRSQPCLRWRTENEMLKVLFL